MKTQMSNQNPSPSSSSSSSTAVAYNGRPLRRQVVEEDGVDPVVCTGKSCQSCTAGVIADCVAVCCCPCAVVDILALTLFKLPWSVARRCIDRRRRKSRRRILEKKRDGCVGDIYGISERKGVEHGISEIVESGIGELDEVNDNFVVELKGDEVWLELGEVGHMGFGRISFTGIPFQDKGN